MYNQLFKIKVTLNLGYVYPFRGYPFVVVHFCRKNAPHHFSEDGLTLYRGFTYVRGR